MKTFVWTPDGKLAFQEGESGPHVHLGYTGSHYVTLCSPGIVWRTRSLMSTTLKPYRCRGGGDRAARPRRGREDREPEPLRLRSRSKTPTQREYQEQRIDDLDRIDGIPWRVEKTWLGVKQWEDGSATGMGIYCFACHRWCENNDRLSKRYRQRVVGYGPYEAVADATEGKKQSASSSSQPATSSRRPILRPSQEFLDRRTRKRTWMKRMSSMSWSCFTEFEFAWENVAEQTI